MLSPKDFNIRTGFAMVCPVTSKAKGGSFEVPCPATAKISGVILCDHLRSIDWLARDMKYHSECPQDTMWEVVGRIEAILAIDCG